MLSSKICKTCKESKEQSEYYFSKQKNKLEADCKKCYQNKKSIKKKERKEKGLLVYKPKKKKCIDCDNLCDARKRVLRCYSCSAKYEYKNSPIRASLLKQVNKKIHSSVEHKKKLSERMKIQRKDPTFNKKLANGFAKSNRVTKLHKKIKAALELNNLGFKSEQLVDKYFADELNENKKIIIEINGDYVHANPKIYKEDEIIRLPNSCYTAKEKWEADRNKKEKLESLGYTIIVVWESDDLEQKRKELHELLTNTLG